MDIMVPYGNYHGLIQNLVVFWHHVVMIDKLLFGNLIKAQKNGINGLLTINIHHQLTVYNLHHQINWN